MEILESSSDINVVGSMIGASRQLSISVEMQFLQLYSRQKLNASLLKVQQQKNLVDCGVFAIAFCTEHCYTGRKGVLLAEFDIMRMRDHLTNCIENMELTPFPKLRRKLKLRKQTEKVLNYSIATDCAALCEFPNSYDDMVQCDTKTPPPPSEHLRPTSGTPFERRFDGRSMVVRGGIGPFTFVRFRSLLLIKS